MKKSGERAIQCGADGDVPTGKPVFDQPVAFEVSTLLVKHPSGVRVYGEGLIRSLAALHPQRSHMQIYRCSRFLRRRLLPEPALPAVPFLTGTRLHCRCSLVHALDTGIPENFRGPLVATLFDVISALPMARERKFSSPDFMARKRRDYRRIARRADLVITISEETRKQFLALERPRARVLVIPPGLSPEFLARVGRPADGGALKRLGISDPYLLAVGAFWPRKNPEAALEVFLRARARMPNLRLLMAGEPGPGWNQRPPLRDWLARAGDGVRILGYLDRGDLAEVYSGAALFLYLSHYEGFGIPVLEAMACGTPVIASGRGGIPEAAGEAALLVNPDDPGEVENAVFRVLLDESCPARLRELGLQRAARFTWEAAARAVDAAYLEALDSWKISSGTNGSRMS